MFVITFFTKTAKRWTEILSQVHFKRLKMLYNNVSIESMTYTLPTEILRSSEIERQLDSALKELRIPTGTLEALTGVKERRVWPKNIKPSTLASLAARKLIAKSGISKEAIQCLLFTGVCKDYIEPATSHLIHHTLGLGENCISFDISDACLGFLKGLAVGASMIESGQLDTVLVTSAENAGPLYENTIAKLNASPKIETFRESLASLTVGSGAAACLLRRLDLTKSGHRLTGWVSKIASNYNDLCRGKGYYEAPLMVTDSVRLMKEGIILAQKTWSQFLEELQWTKETCQHIITHQVSGAHHLKFFQELGLDPTKGRCESSWLGNTGTVAAPMSLAIAEEKNLLQKGDKIAFLGIGSGISSLMMGIEW